MKPVGGLHPVVKIEALIWVSIWRALKFQPFSWSVGSNPRCQSKNIEMIYKTYIKPCAWIIWCMFPIQCEESRINHVTLLLVVTMPNACWFLWRVDYIDEFKWCVHFQFGVGCVLKGCFESCIFGRPRTRLKGIEDFNLEHWLHPTSEVCVGIVSGRSVDFWALCVGFNAKREW